MTAAAPHPQGAPRFAVVVSGHSEAALREFIARHVKPHLFLAKGQWRVRYREQYPLVVLARPLRAGQDPEAVYGPYRAAAVLIAAALDEAEPGSGLAATRDWLKAQGFSPVGWVQVENPGGPEHVAMARGCEIVDFINLRCRWRQDEIEDIDAYLEQNSKPLW